MAASGMVPGNKAQSRPPELEIPVPKADPEAQTEAPPEGEADAEVAEQNSSAGSVAAPVSQPVKAPSMTAVLIAEGNPVVGEVNWDHAFFGVPGVSVVAASDPDPENLKNLQQNCGISGGFEDYREMLARTKPNLVAIPREGTSDRYSIIKTALMSGAHVICPAPFTRALAEADELISLGNRRGLKIAVANPMRVNPNVVRFLQMRQGLIGDLIEIRIFGKMDETSGGKDLLLNGAPLFDLVRMFAGDPVWCSALMTTEGNASTVEMIEAETPWGPVIGDTINAQVYTENGVFVNFVSNPKLKWVSSGWGMEFIGTHRTMRLIAGDQPELALLENPGPIGATDEMKWQLWPENQEPYHLQDRELDGPDVANRVVVFDWLNAINDDRPPCSCGERAMKAMEIVHAIWHAGLSGERVAFPLANREHPLLPSEES